MMFNPQQFPMGAQGGHFPAGPNPAMMGAAGPAGMMQNAAMQHMGANGQMAFQTPYTASPYGGAIPSSAAAAPQVQLPGNYMIAGTMAGPMPGTMAPYQINPGMPQQQAMMQRMHPHPNPVGMNISTPQRPGPFNPAQGNPNTSLAPQPGQFPTPQPHNTPQSQTASNPPQPSSAAATPQTPTFPSTGQQHQANGSASASNPQSPATESREKERFVLLLEINQELMYELLLLTNSRTELKKHQQAVAAGQQKADGDLAAEEMMTNADYMHTLNRLQANLAYQAALADRKPGKPLPGHPAYMMPPPWNLKLKLRVAPTSEGSEHLPDPNSDRAEREQAVKEMYKKLQVMFPGVDPRKEPPPQVSNSRPAPGGGQQMNQGMMKMGNGQMMMGPQNNRSPAPGPQPQKTPQVPDVSGPPQGVQMQMQMGVSGP